MAVDHENKYFFNRLPYLGKDDKISNNVSEIMYTNVFLKPMAFLFETKGNVTCDNYFTLFDRSLS